MNNIVKILPLLFLLGFEDEPLSWTKTIYLDYTVKYQVTGSASSVSLTITNNDGGKSQFSNKSIPFTYSITKRFYLK